MRNTKKVREFKQLSQSRNSTFPWVQFVDLNFYQNAVSRSQDEGKSEKMKVEKSGHPVGTGDMMFFKFFLSCQKLLVYQKLCFNHFQISRYVDGDNTNAVMKYMPKGHT